MFSGSQRNSLNPDDPSGRLKTPTSGSGPGTPGWSECASWGRGGRTWRRHHRRPAGPRDDISAAATRAGSVASPVKRARRSARRSRSGPRSPAGSVMLGAVQKARRGDSTSLLRPQAYHSTTIKSPITFGVVLSDSAAFKELLAMLWYGLGAKSIALARVSCEMGTRPGWFERGPDGRPGAPRASS